MSKKKTFFDLRNFDNYINYEKRKKELFKDYQRGYIQQIEDSLNATDARYKYTKITGKPETLGEYYANNEYLKNKGKVIEDIKNNLQDKDRILRIEENRNYSSGSRTINSDESLQQFPTEDIQAKFFDWIKEKADEIYLDLRGYNSLTDTQRGTMEIEEYQLKMKRQHEEQEAYQDYLNDLPTHNSNGNTIHYNSNGQRVASWEEEQAHWNSVMADEEITKMQEENWDSQYMREEEKRRKEEKEKPVVSVFDVKKPDRKEVMRNKLRDRAKKKRAEAEAAAREKSGSMPAPPPQSFAAPPPLAVPQELTNEWVEKISKSKGTTYYYNTRTTQSSWVKPPTIPDELYHIGWRTKYVKNKNKYDFDFKPEEVWNATKMPENMVRNVENLPVRKKATGWSSALSTTRGYYYYTNNNTGQITYQDNAVKGGKKTRKGKAKGKGKTMKKNIKVNKSIKKKQRKTKRKGKN